MGVQLVPGFLLGSTTPRWSSLYVLPVDVRRCSPRRDTEKCSSWKISYIHLTYKWKMTSFPKVGHWVGVPPAEYEFRGTGSLALSVGDILWRTCSVKVESGNTGQHLWSLSAFCGAHVHPCLKCTEARGYRNEAGFLPVAFAVQRDSHDSCCPWRMAVVVWTILFIFGILWLIVPNLFRNRGQRLLPGRQVLGLWKPSKPLGAESVEWVVWRMSDHWGSGVLQRRGRPRGAWRQGFSLSSQVGHILYSRTPSESGNILWEKAVGVCSSRHCKRSAMAAVWGKAEIGTCEPYRTLFCHSDKKCSIFFIEVNNGLLVLEAE